MIIRCFKLVLAFSIFFSVYSETMIKDFGSESPKIQVKSNNGSEKIVIKTDAEKFEVMRLENPSRLVIDLFNGSEITNSITPISGSEFVEKIRSARHDDKSRVVFDLTKDQFFENVSKNSDGIQVVFSNQKEESGVKTASLDQERELDLSENTMVANEEREDKLADNEKKNLLENSEVEETTIAKLDESSQEITDNQIKPIESIETEEIELAKVSDEEKPVLESVNVESENGQNKLLAILTDRVEYTFGKTSPSEYLLTLENVELGNGVQDSLVFKKDQGNIRNVRSNAKDQNVQLRIFATPDTVLKAEFDGNTLLVKEVEQATNLIRAQALIEEKPTEDNNVKDLLEEDLNEEAPKAKPSPKKVEEKKLEAKPSPKKVEEKKPEAKPSPKKVEEKKPEAKPSPKKVEEKKPEAKKEEELELKPIEEKVDDDFSAPNKGFDEDIDLADLGDKQYTGKLISLDLQDTDIDNALRIIAEVSNLNIIASENVSGKVSLRLVDVPWDQALDVILKTNGLDKVQDGNVIRIAPIDELKKEREALLQAVQAEDDLEPLKVNYIRISYAKAAELQPLVETVLTERGTVTYDERTNQLIVKDIEKGLKNVSKLVQKLDLRTPQVLIETQIVEAQRKFVRELGSELSFTSIQSPETGNATGYNFPNKFEVKGSASDAKGANTGSASFFPAGDQSSALSFVLGSADGTKALGLRLSQGEKDGLVKVVSRPSVAVTNNSPAVIKSTEKLRIKLPEGGGLTVNQGAGAGAAGAGNVATEAIEVGIILNVTAQASPDYYVLMDIEAKSSSLGVKDRGVDGIPPEIERSATSSVLVSSGQTFAMGGIYRISEDDSVAGVPFLKDIPFLGQFFRKTTVSDTDEELIFFITPRIIEGSFDDAAMKSVS